MYNFRWEPFRDLVALQNRVNRTFDDRFFRSEENLASAAVPPVDIYETAEALVLEADVPGLEINDLDIRVENNTLQFRGERCQAPEVKEEDLHRVERTYGAFASTFTLPNTVSADKIAASYENGVLRISMPKREETKPKQIKVEVRRIEAAPKASAKQVA